VGQCPSAEWSGPLSFKALRPRKTREIAARERADSIRVDSRREESPEAVDPRLADSTTSDAILEKVASLIYEHLEEAAAFLVGSPSDDVFHEAHFLRRRWWCCCPWRSPTPERPTVEGILGLLADVSRALFFCHQVVVISAVYIERLLNNTTVVLTPGNWRSIVVVALQTASKVCEDVHPWNADFEDCLLDVAGLRYKSGALYRLESAFLDQLGWKVFVDGEEYGNFYFALLGDRTQDIGGDLLSPLKRPSQRSSINRAPAWDQLGTRIGVIAEDRASASDMGDLERGDTPMSRCSSRASLALVSSSGEKEELVKSWRRMIMQAEGSSALVTRELHAAWRLEKNNPLVGALRHAPCARAPSRHIPESADLLWAHELGKHAMQAMTPSLSGYSASSVCTLSGATGQRLASELRARAR
jgi:hypothetical protein